MTTAVPLPQTRAPKDFAEALSSDRVASLIREHLGGTDFTHVKQSYLRFKGEDGALVGWWLLDQKGENCGHVTCRLASRPRLEIEAERLEGLSCQTRGDLRPMALLPHLDILLLAFPMDRQLRRLRHLTRFSRVRSLVEESVPILMPEGFRIRRRNTSMDVIRYKPERRAVLCWNFSLRSEVDGVSQVIKSFWRLHGDDRALQSQSALKSAHLANLRVPMPLAAIGKRLAIESYLEGSPGSFDDNLAWYSTGVMLARLHAVASLKEHKSLIPLHELDACYQLANDIAIIDPVAGKKAGAIVERLAATIPARGESVFLHGDFHHGQILFKSGVPGLTDFDRSQAGPAEFDLGSFIAHAELDCSPEISTSVKDSFLQGYQSQRSISAIPEASWFTSAARLRLALTPFRRMELNWPSRLHDLLDRVHEAAWA